MEYKRYFVRVFICAALIFLIWNYCHLINSLMQGSGIRRVIDPPSTKEEFSRNAQDWYNYSIAELNITRMLQDDPNLIKIVRKKFLIQPSQLEYNLTQPEIYDQSMGQGEKIRAILNNKPDGFFVECGALDGETRSNTLYFERFLGWKGLLIEADPLNFQEVIYKNRRAWLAPTCLSLKKTPTLVNFQQQKNLGKIMSPDEKNRGAKYAQVLCIPLTTLLLALEMKRIDYLSLDVEGNELDVLKTIDFDRFNIRTLSVEFSHVRQGQKAMERFMDGKGYVVHSIVARADHLANDFIFRKKAKK